MAWWSIGIGGLVIATVAFWPSFQGSTSLTDLIDQMPGAMVEALGMADFGTPVGYLRGNLYAVFVPLLLALAAVALVNSVTAGEESNGRLELYLAQPVGRRAAFLGRAAAALIGLTVITVALAAFQLAGDALVDLRIDTGYLVATIALCGLLAALHGALAVAIAGARPRPPLVLGIGIAVAIGGYLVFALFPLNEVLEPWRHLSPWDWALGGDPLAGRTEPWRFGVLALPTILLAAIGAWAVGRRDVAAG